MGLLQAIAEPALEILEVETIDVVADKGYFKTEDIAACEKAGLTPGLRDRRPRLVDGARRPGSGVRHGPRPRHHRQEAPGPPDSHASGSAARPREAGADRGARRPGDPLLSGRAPDAEQRRQLVRRPVQGTWLRGLLVAFRPARLHHPRRPQHSSLG